MRPLERRDSGQHDLLRARLDQIKRELRRRSAVEPVSGHMKEEHRTGRNHLAGRRGDAVNALLAAVGYNFRRLLVWLAAFLCALIADALGTENPPLNDRHAT